MGILNLFRKKEEKEISLDLIKIVKGDFDNFKKRLKSSSLIMLIIGKRGSGKTALGFELLELLTGKRNAYYLGKAKLPWWIKQVDDIEKISNNSIVLVDEAAIAYSSRESMSKSNKFLSSLMAIARHRGLSLIICSQNSAMLELNILRLSDTLFFKESSLLQTKFERKAIGDLFKKADDVFNKIKDNDKRKYSYVIDDEFEGLITFNLPEFWNEKISKSYANFGK